MRLSPPATTAPTTAAMTRPVASLSPESETAVSSDGAQQRLGQLISIDDTERSEDAGDGKHNGQGVTATTGGLLDDVHRAALRFAVSVAAAVCHGEEAFVIFGSHAHQCAHPHPEDGARSADNQSDGHSCDIAHADSCGHN